MARAERVCVVGHNSADFLGVLPAFLAEAGGGECGRLLVYSYYSPAALARKAAGMPEGSTLVLAGHAALMAPAAAGAAGGGVRVVAVAAWRRALRLLEGLEGVEVVPVRLPGFYEALPARLKWEASLALRLVEALHPRRSRAASILASSLPLLAGAASTPEVDVEALVESLVARLREAAGGRRPNDVIEGFLAKARPRLVYDASRTAGVPFKVYALPRVNARDLPLLLPAARALARRANAQATALAAPAREGALLAAWTSNPWTLETLLKAFKVARRLGVDGVSAPAHTPTTLEGIVEPGALLQASLPPLA